MAGRREIRVAMVHGPGPPCRDGVSDYVAHLIDALADVEVAAVGVPVVPTGPGRWSVATVRAATAVRRLRPHLVHVQFAPSAYRFSALPGLLPLLLPRGTPLVTTMHEYDPEAGRASTVCWRVVEALRLWDRQAGRLIADSRAVVVTNPAHAACVRAARANAARGDTTRVRAARASARIGGPAGSVVEIPLAPNVVDHGGRRDARSRVRRRLGMSAEATLLVFFGFVHPVKGVRYVLEALPALRHEWPDLRFVVVGGFASQALPADEARAFHAELTALAEEVGVGDAVTFTGHVDADEVSELLSAADAVVLPFTAGVTLKSGALLAALAHGAPTAVTLADEPDDRLRDGENVALIPARRDAATVAGTLRRLLRDEPLRRRLSAGGRALAAARSWPGVAVAHRRLYEQILDEQVLGEWILDGRDG